MRGKAQLRCLARDEARRLRTSKLVRGKSRDGHRAVRGPGAKREGVVDRGGGVAEQDDGGGAQPWVVLEQSAPNLPQPRGVVAPPAHLRARERERARERRMHTIEFRVRGGRGGRVWRH